MKMYQISEDDLETLESTLPSLQDALLWPQTNGMPINDRRVQEWLAMAKRIISDVRWNYGPHQHVETLSAEGSGGDA